MSGGGFLMGKSQKRDFAPFPGSPGPFSDPPLHSRAPETSPFLNRRLEFIWEVPPLMIAASPTLARDCSHLWTLTQEVRLWGQAQVATRGGDSGGRWGLRARGGLCVG